MKNKKRNVLIDTIIPAIVMTVIVWVPIIEWLFQPVY